MGTQVISVTNTNFAQRLDVNSKQVGGSRSSEKQQLL